MGHVRQSAAPSFLPSTATERGPRPKPNPLSRGTEGSNPSSSSRECVSRMGRAAAVRDLELGGTVECRFGDREIIAGKAYPASVLRRRWLNLSGEAVLSLARNHYGGSAWEGSRESPSRREIRRYGRSLMNLSRSKSRRGRFRCRQWRGRPPRSEHDRPTAPPRPDRHPSRFRLATLRTAGVQPSRRHPDQSLHRLSYSTPDATNLVSQLSCTGIMVARPSASAMMLSPGWESLLSMMILK